ncbi:MULTISPECIES: DUF5956 family protein [Micromonospora]|uniref:Uncharacterized protein n=1 Tax=Micromonospora solifontis TaxID=2487138 RepID=A0ABX9WBQ0_9ACTN|nr:MULTISPECIES: DUF5956 family protein [Micromonospora]NES17060.1 hypothetical protein [Micromonospora sp. PPF5-17B]NES38584.1 hypothetical protein [Micromonospora solifontis]NES58784.1 hypothetical protein [Micromonospora sp. PPF5-6]RNL94559.1 hypothetical protein EFE23_20905 [Micromonospora solifontis]
MDIGYDWGVDQSAHPAAARAPDVDGLTPEQLPEVRELTARGWHLAPDAPMLVFLPAVWPRPLRTWVPDRAARYETWYEQNPTTYEVLREQTMRSSWESRTEVDNDTDALLAKAGITRRPRGRLWLLKPPPGFADLDGFLTDLGRRADAAGIEGACSRQYVWFTAERLRDLTGE